MTTTHKMRATIQHGPSDLGAEVDCEITFTYLQGAPAQGLSYASGGQPADPDEIEFVSASLTDTTGKRIPWSNPRPYSDYSQAWLDELARDWLAEDGYNAALDCAMRDNDAAREDAAEMRAEMRREDRERGD